jgi:hypothetical protein
LGAIASPAIAQTTTAPTTTNAIPTAGEKPRRALGAASSAAGVATTASLTRSPSRS